MATDLKAEIERFLAEGHSMREVYAALKAVQDERPADKTEFGRTLYKAVEILTGVVQAPEWDAAEVHRMVVEWITRGGDPGAALRAIYSVIMKGGEGG